MNRCRASRLPGGGVLSTQRLRPGAALDFDTQLCESGSQCVRVRTWLRGATWTIPTKWFDHVLLAEVVLDARRFRSWSKSMTRTGVLN